MLEGLSADSEEKREPASDIDAVVVDSLKALDPERPIREEKRTYRPSIILLNADLSTGQATIRIRA